MIGLFGSGIIKDEINSTESFANFFDSHLYKKQGVETYYTKILLLLGISPDEDIAVLGRHGFLFVANSNDREMDAFRGLREFDETHYLLAIDRLAGLKDYFEGQDIDFLLMIPPDKSTIYSDYIPIRITRTGITPRDVFMERVREAGLDEYVLDMTPILLEARESVEPGLEDYLYYKGDSHWNDFGGYVGFEGYLAHENIEDFPVFNGVLIETFRGTPDLAKLIRAAYYTDYEVNVEFDPSFPPYKEIKLTENSEWRALFLMENDDALYDKTVFLLRDSFALAQLDYFSALYSEVYVVHYYHVLLDENVDELEKMIEDYDPDEVILEIVERRIVDALMQFTDVSVLE
jgi:hypothetical protein